MTISDLQRLHVAVTPSAAKRIPRNFIRCEIGKNLKFRTDGLESYFFSDWCPMLFDAMLVAAAVEFCDRSRQRSTVAWARHFILQIPVHDPHHWNKPAVMYSLLDALQALTGDYWELRFIGKDKPHPAPTVRHLNLPKEVTGVIPFSDGLDSKAVHGLIENELGDGLVRVRLGTANFAHEQGVDHRRPFASIPYKIKSAGNRFPEPSARSRGFKFATTSIIAAYLAKAPRIYVPESGQGALGPALTTVGQSHPDYRTHPFFLRKMESYFEALLDWKPHFVFPRLWHTKAQTLTEYIALPNDAPDSWKSTRSCWQQSGQASVNGHKRQCGVCAACMLRRLSIHGAGLEEPKETYVWENLSVPSLDEGCAVGFDKSRITQKMRDYAIAGTLHLQHLADLRHSPADNKSLELESGRIASSCNISLQEAKDNLDGLLEQHEKEWSAFLCSLGSTSFINQWVRRNK